MHRAMRQQLRQEKHKVGYEFSHQWAKREPEYFPAEEGTIVTAERNWDNRAAKF